MPAVANCEAKWKDVTDLDGQKLFDGGYERALDWMNMAVIVWWSLLSTGFHCRLRPVDSSE